ncbi:MULTISPECIES: fimbrial chaperone [Escherichia]|uniref:fimbrial chaperone n=1 Tax=Escherichia TaxID=561 RepID=UPI0007E35B4C|nr:MULTISPECIES: fimbrial chaperone [Escherichia]MEC9497276.1 fimbrial chaperone [Escherichia whittamii]MEC9558926.1 fimbrial chaperone [Escherichia whittamii]QLX43305.1 fimbrial chaperone [Escherichia coli]
MLIGHKFNIAALTAIFSIFSPLTQADIVINGTRIIYAEKDKNVNTRLENKGTRPLLVQTWLDTGNDNADPSSIKVPFNATPPVSRIEPKHGQTITITYTGSQQLPKDRESVFWFNVLEIPPKASDAEVADKNLLQLAFRTRIKLFYRPTGLTGESFDAPAAIKWRWNGNKISVTNPTQYHVSYASATLKANGKEYAVKTTMVPPKGDAVFSVDGLNSAVSGAKITYSAINDFGSSVTGHASL